VPAAAWVPVAACPPLPARAGKLFIARGPMAHGTKKELKMRKRGLLAILFLAVLAACAGCPPPEETGPEGPTTGGPTGGEEGKFVLGDLIEPFDPPTLEELNAKVEWVDQPVLDSIQLLRERQAGEKMLATVQQALALRNTSPEANEKICSALGRLPEKDDQVDWNATIFRHTSGDVKSTNPLMVSSTTEFDVTGLTGFGLFGFDWNFHPFAMSDSVASWQTSKDRMYDKVVMRDDLTWSDGEPITAQDVVFSYQVILSSQVPVPAVRPGTDQIKWIEAYDDWTLVFFHKEALATNVWNLNFPVIPKHIYEKSVYDDHTLQDSAYHVKYENNPVVGGPYIITKRVRGQEIVLQRRDDYFMHKGVQVRDRPYFKEVYFRVMPEPSVSLLALKRGDIDELMLTPQQWVSETDDEEFYKSCTKAYGTEWVNWYFGWNCKTPFFSDVRVRKAMSYAFNHDEMLDKLLYGLYEPCVGTFHPESPWCPHPPPKPYKQDLDKAEALLDEAGWTDHDGDGVRDKQIAGRTQKFEFSILTFNLPVRVAICNLLKENLDRIGVICHVRPMEFTVLQQKSRDHQFHAIMAGWGTGADPDTSRNIWVTGENRNYGEYSNPEVDRLFDDARRVFDRKERAKIYQRIHRILWDEQPYTWLYTRNSFYGFNKKLRGYNFSPRGPYNYGPGFSSIWKPAVN
jgi:peptide/nickel transport system substrate-binding protein